MLTISVRGRPSRPRSVGTSARLSHLLDEPPPRKPGSGSPVLDARWFPVGCESPRRVERGLMTLIYAPGEGPLEVARQPVSLARGEVRGGSGQWGRLFVLHMFVYGALGGMRLQ